MVHDMGLMGKVMLPGYHKEAWRYLPYCHVFAITSLTEGLPVTLLEAMHVGTPIVATAVGDIPYVLEQGITGLLVPPREPIPICHAFEEIFNDKIRADERVSKAKKLIESKYSSATMAKKYSAVYRSVMRPSVS